MEAIDFDDPKQAREYVNNFDARVLHGIGMDRVTTDEREYVFAELNDEEICHVAKMLYRDVEEPAHKNWSRQ